MSRVISSPLVSVEQARTKPLGKSRWHEAIPLSLLAIGVLLLFLSSPYHSDMWWSDAPRHATDGAFYHDLFRDLPWGHFRQYAMDYYLQYPALAILFYPPLFPVVEAVFFGIFGVSYFSAMLTVAVFYLAAAWGAYFLCRRWLSPAAAFSVSLLFAGAPEVALWGRQVMLEIPACAFLICSSAVFFRYLERGTPRLFYLLTVLWAAGAYTKQTILLIVPVLLFVLWYQKGWPVFAKREILRGGVLFVVLLAPLIWMSVTFGHVNTDSVTGGIWNQMPVFSWNGWLYYVKQFPKQTNWVVFVLAGLSFTTSLLYTKWRGQGEVFFGGWLIFGYIFFSFIALKEPRHTVVILLPLAFFAVQGILRVAPRQVAPGAVLLLAVLSFGHTLLRKHVPYLRGYAEAVDYVAARSPRDGVILFSGYRDGAFIFNMRTREDRRDLSVLRADKLLLKVTQRRELGVQERDYNQAQIAEMLTRYGVSYVVNQPNFWDDLKNMQQLQRVLHTSQFRLLATIPITSNVGHGDHQLEIYENLSPLNAQRERITLDLPLAGVVVEGHLGHRSGK